MHILVLADRFTPEVTAVSVRTHAHAKVWIEQGHEVTVVTSAPNFPKGEVFPGYENKLFQEEFVDGIRIIRIGTYMAANEGMIRRTFDYLSFTFSAIFQCGRFPKFDVLIATSPPIFVAMAGQVIGMLKRKPWIFEIRDLWPASIAAVGAGKKGFVLSMVEKYELWLYKKAARIIALTHSFKEDLTGRGIDGNKIAVVTNGIEVESFKRPESSDEARADIGVTDENFLLGYIGTTGMAHGLETLLDAADKCRDEKNIKFLIMGEGAKRNFLEERAKELKLDNLIFKNFVPHNEVVKYLSALDMSIVHLKPDPVFKTVIPSKIFEAMALGVPTIHAVEGESADIIKACKAGACVPSGDADAIAEKARYFYSHRDELQSMSEAAQRAVRAQYDRSALAKDILEVLEPLVADKEGGLALHEH